MIKPRANASAHHRSGNDCALADSLAFESHLISVIKAIDRSPNIELKSRDLLSNSNLCLNHGQWNRLLSDIFCAVDIEFPALQETSELLCRCLINAKTLGKSLSLVERFTQNTCIAKLVSRSNGDEIIWEIFGNTTWLADILQMASYLKLLSWLVGEQIPVLRVDLNLCKENQATKAIGLLFNCEAHSDCEQMALTIDSEWLNRPVVRTYSDMRAILALPSLALIPWPPATSLKDKVMELLIKMIDRHERTPTLREIAFFLRRSESSLRRQLFHEGTSFQLIKSTWREQRAKELLRGTSTMVDIAPMLGFESPSVFSRAFKSWTGMAPLTFRLSQRRAESVNRGTTPSLA